MTATLYAKAGLKYSNPASGAAWAWTCMPPVAQHRWTACNSCGVGVTAHIYVCKFIFILLCIEVSTILHV